MAKETKCRPSDLTDEEARAEAEFLRPAFERADEEDASLLATCWHDDEEPVLVIRVHS